MAVRFRIRTIREYSTDGRTMVSTLFERRDSLVRVDFRAAPLPMPTALTNGYGGDLDPNLSRRGDRMVFSSTRSGQRNLRGRHSTSTRSSLRTDSRSPSFPTVAANAVCGSWRQTAGFRAGC